MSDDKKVRTKEDGMTGTYNPSSRLPIERCDSTVSYFTRLGYKVDWDSDRRGGYYEISSGGPD